MTTLHRPNQVKYKDQNLSDQTKPTKPSKLDLPNKTKPTIPNQTKQQQTQQQIKQQQQK